MMNHSLQTITHLTNPSVCEIKVAMPLCTHIEETCRTTTLGIDLKSGVQFQVHTNIRRCDGRSE